MPDPTVYVTHETVYAVGTPVRKLGGSYQADGWVAAAFRTRAGGARYVFEFAEPKGLLHIFAGYQLEERDA